VDGDDAPGTHAHQRGKGWVRRGLASEEKAAQVELIEEKNDGGVFDVPMVGVAPVVSDGVSEALQCCGAEMEVGLG
jgi:5,10-methenyltetrahydromethanopterin hydrogenase